jgi:hypothetical protein
MARALEMAAITTIPTNMEQYGMEEMAAITTILINMEQCGMEGMATDKATSI